VEPRQLPWFATAAFMLAQRRRRFGVLTASWAVGVLVGGEVLGAS
jgi:hypothetical protein